MEKRKSEPAQIFRKCQLCPGDRIKVKASLFSVLLFSVHPAPPFSELDEPRENRGTDFKEGETFHEKNIFDFRNYFSYFDIHRRLLCAHESWTGKCWICSCSRSLDHDMFFILPEWETSLIPAKQRYRYPLDASSNARKYGSLFPPHYR